MRTSKLRKAVSNAKDQRMSALNELIGAVRSQYTGTLARISYSQKIKFVKLFAQEYEWTDRILEARKKELALLAKGPYLLLHLPLI